MHEFTSNGYIKEAVAKKLGVKAIKDMDKGDYKKLRDAYYGVADNITNMSEALNTLNGESGEFSIDNGIAQKMVKLFNNMDIGKYI